MRHQNIFFVLLLLSVPYAQLKAQDARGAADPSGTTTIGSTLGLQQCVAIAIKNNLTVNQSDITLQQNRVQLSQAWDNLLPQINASASQNIGFGRSLITSSYTYTDAQTTSGSYGLNAGLTLFNGLRLQNNIRANSYFYKSAQLDLQQQKDNITLTVLLDYLAILAAQDVLGIAHEQADVDKRQLDRLEIQNREGALLLLTNLTDLRGQYASDLANIAVDSNIVEANKITLFNVLNVPYKRNVDYDRNAFTLDITDYTQPSDSIYATALNTQPSIRSNDLKILGYRRALSAARGAYYPNLSFGVNVNSYYSNAAAPNLTPTGVFQDQVLPQIVTVGGTNYNVINPHQEVFNASTASWGDQFKNNRQTSIGLSLNIPILNYLQVRNNVKQAKITLRNSELNANSVRLVLQQNVEAAYQNMIAAYKTYKADIDAAAAFTESFRTQQIRFDEGVITSDVYVQAKNRSDAAQVNLSQAKYTYIFRTKVLDYYQGRLTWTTK